MINISNMKSLLIGILCTVSTLLSAQTIDFDEVTFTKYATVMSENDIGNPSAWRDVHNGKFTVRLEIDDRYRAIIIENVSSDDLGIENVDYLYVLEDFKTTAVNDGSIVLVFHGVPFIDFVLVGLNMQAGPIEEMVEKMEHIYVALFYASDTNTTPYGMTISVGSVNAFPKTIFYNDTANNSANRPSQGIKPSATSGTLNGHEWVDLGLPSGTKWATCNIGTSTPSGYGNYYAWGEVATKSSYSNCKTYGKNMPDIAGDSRYDAASASWGANWKIPTKAQIDELLDKRYCVWEWTKVNGTNGYKVTSKENGNSIFLPAAGYRVDTSLYGTASLGYYWCSTPLSSNKNAYGLYIDNNGHFYSYYSRYIGCLVRPVTD